MLFCYKNSFEDVIARVKKSQGFEEEVLLKLALSHPDIYVPILSKKSNSSPSQIQEVIQGKRSFNPTFHAENCSSKELWGYDCPWLSEPLELDHDFPYSMGGPTDSACNKRVLCSWHNRLKGNDIHVYNWVQLFDEVKYHRESNREHWIDQQFKKILYEANL